MLVTGGSSGLGAATSQLFIDEGAKVFVTDLEERGIVEKLGGSKNVTYMKCDVSSPEDCSAAVKACVEKYGKLDVLFHNAARLGVTSTVVDHDVELFQKVINTNLCSGFYLARAAIPEMRKQGKGAIVNTCSTSGLAGDYGLCSYNAAKAGMVNLTKAMALDHAREGIRVNCICPGYMFTAMTEGMRQAPALFKELNDTIPMGHGTDPVDVGRCVLFLASDEAAFVTGHGKLGKGREGSLLIAIYSYGR